MLQTERGRRHIGLRLLPHGFELMQQGMDLIGGVGVDGARERGLVCTNQRYLTVGYNESLVRSGRI